MRFATSISVAALSLSGMATAQPVASSSPSAAILTVEASHGGAGSGLTNTTITVPFNEPFNADDSVALNEVSTLYVTGSTNNVPVQSISCTTYGTPDGTGSHGVVFTEETPSYLSTNTVQVGSVICHSSVVNQ